MTLFSILRHCACVWICISFTAKLGICHFICQIQDPVVTRIKTPDRNPTEPLFFPRIFYFLPKYHRANINPDWCV